MTSFIYKKILQTREMFADTFFLSKTAAIAFPVAFQAMLNMITNLADTLMIGKLGENPIAAVGLGNKVFFVYTLLVFGISSGIGILSAQYYGNNDIKNIRKVLGIGLIIALTASIIFTGATLFIPDILMKIFTNSPEAITLGIAYLSLVGLSYPFTAVSNIYISSIRAMGEVKLPILTSFITILINVFLNYIFIFGKLGMPSMGVAGAALATVVARIIEMLLILLLLRLKKHPTVYHIKEMLGYPKDLILQFTKTSVPTILNEFFWGLGITLYSVAYGRMGNKAVAAITIATTLQDLLQVGATGLAAATIVILGFEMGSGNLKRAKTYATYFHLLTIIVSLIISFTTIVVRKPFISLYAVSPEVYTDIMLCLLVFAIYFPFKCMAIVNIVGILRSGGDTFACFLLDLSGVWIIGIPFAFIGALVWKFPIYGVYTLVMIEEVYKVFIGYARYKKYKWLKNLNLELQKN